MTYASVLLGSGQTTGVEEKLQAAEGALQDAEPDDRTRDLIGRIAAVRATLALDPAPGRRRSSPSRAAPWSICTPTTCRSARPLAGRWGMPTSSRATVPRPGRAYAEAMSISQASGNTVTDIMATIGLGHMQEPDNQLVSGGRDLPARPATGGDLPLPVDQRSASWPGPYPLPMERPGCRRTARAAEPPTGAAAWKPSTDPSSCEVFLARLKLARGDVAGAAAMLAEAERSCASITSCSGCLRLLPRRC